MGLFSQKNTGKDVTVTMLTAAGPVVISPLTRFNARQMSHALESRPLNGRPVFDELPDGWQGELEWDRDSVNADSFFATAEQGYFSGAPQILQVTIDELVQEVNGNTSHFVFEGVALKFDDAGDWRKEAFVKCKASFRASDRVQI